MLPVQLAFELDPACFTMNVACLVMLEIYVAPLDAVMDNSGRRLAGSTVILIVNDPQHKTKISWHALRTVSTNESLVKSC